MDSRRESSENDDIFALHDELAIYNQWTADDLFAHDCDYENETELKDFNALTYDSSDDQDFSRVNNEDFLSHTVLGSAAGMLPSQGLKGDMEHTTQHVPSFILSGPHHAPFIFPSTRSKADQKERHAQSADSPAQLETTLPSQVAGSNESNLGEEFIELDADWEEDERSLYLMGHEY